MMKSLAKLGLAGSALALMLTACASAPTLAPAGAFKAGGPTVTLDRDWSLYPQGMGPKTKMLTIDGLLLNRLYVSDGLSGTDPLFVDPIKGDNESNPAPRAKGEMSLSEHMEYVTNAVTVLGYLKVETRNPKPVTISGVKGVRFEFTAKTTEGLNIHGLAQAASAKGLNYYIVYIAPDEHYYAASLTNVTAAMDSEKLP